MCSRILRGFEDETNVFHGRRGDLGDGTDLGEANLYVAYIYVDNRRVASACRLMELHEEILYKHSLWSG